MGRIKTKDIKTAAQTMYKKRPELFSSEFDNNRDVLKEMEAVKEKKMRNKIAGSLVRLSRRKKQ